VRGRGVHGAEPLPGQERLVRRRPHVGPGVGLEVIKPDVGILELDATAPLVAVPQRRPRETHEAPVGQVEDVGPIDTTEAGGRCVGELLPPGAGVQVESEEVKALGNAVVTALVNPLALVRVVTAAALPAEPGGRGALARTLLDPLVFRVAGPGGPDAGS